MIGFQSACRHIIIDHCLEAPSIVRLLISASISSSAHLTLIRGRNAVGLTPIAWRHAFPNSKGPTKRVRVFEAKRRLIFQSIHTPIRHRKKPTLPLFGKGGMHFLCACSYALAAEYPPVLRLRNRNVLGLLGLLPLSLNLFDPVQPYPDRIAHNSFRLPHLHCRFPTASLG